MSFNTEPFSWAKINLGEAFRLVDSLFSAQSCLDHQILPLSLKEQCLILGMVNPDDDMALGYARSRLANHNYSLNVQTIDGKTHQLLFAAYTKSAQKLQAQPQANQPSAPSATQQQPVPSKPPININERPTLIVLREEELPPDSHTTAEDSSNSASSSTNLEPQLEDAEAEDISTAFYFPPSLNLHSQYPSASPELLASLPPQQLWQELLIRMISQGIGRLYFEHHGEWGRILWINNGVLQLSLDKLTPKLFEGIIQQLKQLAQLPPELVAKPRQGEVVRVYQQEQILLRWRVNPNKHGEEGTLQVLRGKALEFYQQRQMDELGEQAVRLAQTLERKLKQIQALAKSNPANLEALPALHRLQEKICQQLDLIDRL